MQACTCVFACCFAYNGEMSDSSCTLEGKSMHGHQHISYVQCDGFHALLPLVLLWELCQWHTLCNTLHNAAHTLTTSAIGIVTVAVTVAVTATVTVSGVPA